MTRLDELINTYKFECKHPTIFLSGAMTGLTESERKNWREWLKENCGSTYYIVDPTVFDAESGDKDVQDLGHEYDICAIINCDYFIVNLNKVRTSTGTCQEIMLAWLLGKKIIGFFESKELAQPLHPWIENKLDRKMMGINTLKIYLVMEYCKKWRKNEKQD